MNNNNALTNQQIHARTQEALTKWAHSEYVSKENIPDYWPKLVQKVMGRYAPEALKLAPDTFEAMYNGDGVYTVLQLQTILSMLANQSMLSIEMDITQYMRLQKDIASVKDALRAICEPKQKSLQRKYEKDLEQEEQKNAREKKTIKMPTGAA